MTPVVAAAIVGAAAYALVRPLQETGRVTRVLAHPVLVALVSGLIAFGAVSCRDSARNASAWDPAVTELRDAAALEAFLEEKPDALLYFHADWCGVCKMMSPEINAIAAAGTPVAVADVDAASALARQYQVQGVPTTVLFAGGEPSGVMAGYLPKDDLLRALKNGAGSGPPR